MYVRVACMLAWMWWELGTVGTGEHAVAGRASTACLSSRPGRGARRLTRVPGDRPAGLGCSLFCTFCREGGEKPEGDDGNLSVKFPRCTLHMQHAWAGRLAEKKRTH